MQPNILGACTPEICTVGNIEQVLFFQELLKYEEDNNSEIQSCTELQENCHSFIPVINMKVQQGASVGNGGRKEQSVSDYLGGDKSH